MPLFFCGLTEGLGRESLPAPRLVLCRAIDPLPLPDTVSEEGFSGHLRPLPRFVLTPLLLPAVLLNSLHPSLVLRLFCVFVGG